jgi:prevent-host-death family protein
MKTVTAAEANRHFSRLLGEVRRGETVIVTSHGTPVAKIVPAETADEATRREAARRELFERLRSQPALNLGKMSRDEMHDDQDDYA